MQYYSPGSPQWETGKSEVQHIQMSAKAAWKWHDGFMISPRGGRPFSLELRSANETCHPLHCMCCTSHKTWQAFLKKELHKNHSSTDRPICISLLSEIRHLASKHLLPKMLFRVGIHEVKILLFIYRLGFRLQMLKITVLLIMVKIHIKYLI